MQKIYFLLFAFASLCGLHSQEKIKQYVIANATRLSSIQPDLTDFTDLEPFGKAVGNARIVMLGEQDHGDAPSFLAKTRLIKYLHEKKGFRVLAFEADFFALNFSSQEMAAAPDRSDSFLMNNIPPVWTMCDACNDLLYKYIPAVQKTGQAFEVAGFDIHQFTPYARNKLINKLDSVCRKLHIPIVDSKDYTTTILPNIEVLTKSFSLADGEVSFNKRKEYLDLIKTQLKAVLPENDF